MISIFAMATAAAAIPAPEKAAIFMAAGATRRGAGWVMCREDARASATIETYRDINGDGRPDAVVTEGSTYCNGASENGFVVLSKQADGKWKQMTGMSGIPEFLKTKGVGGWPDLLVGGPGFCFPVLRWNGRDYINQRLEYEGKPCRR
jgi:hypothetical protein